ncbi:hypothetical protein HanIR_Chr14g0706781 [Helianthus annuus]|nr:hypothetical protein HanIR_Chr14g0706781 [Helianthus annuus]
MSFVNNPILHSIICLHDHFKTGNFLTKKHSKENQFVSNLSTPIPTIPYKASQRFNLFKNPRPWWCGRSGTGEV